MRAPSCHSHAFNLALILASLFCALSLMTGCGGASIDTADQARFTALSSSAATVRVNQQVQFTNNGLKLGSKMTFYVDGIQGGNTLLGTVDGNGLYTAPAIVPVPNSVTVTANSDDHPTFPQGTASVSVLNPIPVISAVTPSTFPEGTAQIAVNGSQFVFGAQIIWNGARFPPP